MCITDAPASIRQLNYGQAVANLVLSTTPLLIYLCFVKQIPDIV